MKLARLGSLRLKRAWVVLGVAIVIGVDADSRLMRATIGTAANAPDATQAHKLQHGEERGAFVSVGYRGAPKLQDVIDAGYSVCRNVAMMMVSEMRAVDQRRARTLDELERVNTRFRAKAAHLFRVLDQQGPMGRCLKPLTPRLVHLTPLCL